jgi:hypothetical protein
VLSTNSQRCLRCATDLLATDKAARYQAGQPEEDHALLPSTAEEIAEITEYVEWQAPDLKVTFCQKIYSESVLSHRHDVWDVHTSKDRWWVITNPTNLYSQEQFPNMDYAVTFHMGLMLRMPRSERPAISEGAIEPFATAFEALSAAHGALGQAHQVSDFQAVGVRCREALLGFVAIAQVVVPWGKEGEPPKAADFKAWADHVCSVVLPGEGNKARRQLFKAQADAAWTFANWLTHSKSSNWHDAEAAVQAAEMVVSLWTNATTLYIRKVPNECPMCGSFRLTPLRAENPNDPDEVWERPFCTDCEWMGEPVRITTNPVPIFTREGAADDGECVVPTVPLRKLARPGIDNGNADD